MAKLIRNRRVVADNWLLLELGAGGGTNGNSPSVPAEGDIIVPLKVWLARHDALAVRLGQTGVWLDSNEGAETIAADLRRLPLIALRFPAFTDGRGYSTARLLRERYGYQGELRAVGEVLGDQLFYMLRCGFDAFELAAGKNVELALKCFDDFSVTYQAATDDPRPLYRRAHRGEHA